MDGVEPGDAEAAEPLLHQALSLLTGQGDERLLVEVHAHLAIIAEMPRQPDEAIPLHERAIAIARAAGDHWALGVALNNYALMRPLRSDMPRTISLLEEALATLRPTGDAYMISMVNANRAEFALEGGDIETAQRLTDEALSVGRQVDFRPLIAGMLEFGAVIAFDRGDVETAAARVREALEMGMPLQSEALAVRPALVGSLAAAHRDPLGNAVERIRAGLQAHRDRQPGDPQAPTDEMGGASARGCPRPGTLGVLLEGRSGDACGGCARARHRVARPGRAVSADERHGDGTLNVSNDPVRLGDEAQPGPGVAGWDSLGHVHFGAIPLRGIKRHLVRVRTRRARRPRHDRPNAPNRDARRGDGECGRSCLRAHYLLPDGPAHSTRAAPRTQPVTVSARH
jgi:hypothetical protein